jgi:hypothetical protein
MRLAMLVSWTLLALSPVVAQTTAPTTTAPTSPAPAPTGAAGIADWWWVILIVLLAAVAIWYFMRNRRP